MPTSLGALASVGVCPEKKGRYSYTALAGDSSSPKAVGLERGPLRSHFTREYGVECSYYLYIYQQYGSYQQETITLGMLERSALQEQLEHTNDRKLNIIQQQQPQSAHDNRSGQSMHKHKHVQVCGQEREALCVVTRGAVEPSPHVVNLYQPDSIQQYNSSRVYEQQ